MTAPNCIKIPLGQDESFQPRSSGTTSVNRKTFQFLWQYLAPYKTHLLLAVLASIPMAGVGGLIPWLFKRVTEHLSSGGELSSLVFLMGICFLLFLARGGLEIVNLYLLTVLHTYLNNDIRSDLFTSLQQDSLHLHTSHRSGELASLIANDSQSAASGVVDFYTLIWLAPSHLLLLIGMMIWFNPGMAAFAVISVPILSWCATRAGHKARDAERSFLDRQGKILAWMIESLTNIRQVKSFNLENETSAKVAAYGQELIFYRKKSILMKAIVAPVSEIANGLSILAMIVYAYYQVQNDLTTTADIVGCLVAAVSLQKPAKAIASSLVQLQRSAAAVQRIDWLIGKLEDRDIRPPLEGPIHSIEFNNVSFSYDGKRDILQNVSFRAHRGERIAIIGSSGSGKTTLLDLLTGLYPARAGAILINGQEISTLDRPSIYRHIGVVSQEPLLFDASIEENIRSGYRQANTEQISEAIRKANCQEIIARLPDGLQSRVGERGSILSGGERKRIAVARAIVRPISLLILDEATSELDLCAEEAVLSALDPLSDDLLVIHTSHKHAVVDHCDRILLLEDGSVREISHQEWQKSAFAEKSTSGERR